MMLKDNSNVFFNGLFVILKYSIKYSYYYSHPKDIPTLFFNLRQYNNLIPLLSYVRFLRHLNNIGVTHSDQNCGRNNFQHLVNKFVK